MADVFSSMADGPSRAHLRAAAIQAGEQLGIFGRLEEEARSIDELAWHLGLASVHRLQALLDVLVCEKLLARDGGGEDASFSLPQRINTGPRLPSAYWGRIAEVIRSDDPLEEPGIRGSDQTSHGALQRFHAHLFEAGSAAAHELMAPLANAIGGTLLDLGSGAGIYAKAWLEAQADARAVLFDRPEVLALASDALLSSGFSPRIELRSADLFDPAPWPRARVVLLANLLHLFGPEEAQQLIARAAQAVEPGGVVVIKDLRLDDDRASPAAGVLFSLNMALFTAQGRVHTREALLGFLGGAGLHSPKARRLDCAPDAIVAHGDKPLEPA